MTAGPRRTVKPETARIGLERALTFKSVKDAGEQTRDEETDNQRDEQVAEMALARPPALSRKQIAEVFSFLRHC